MDHVFMKKFEYLMRTAGEDYNLYLLASAYSEELYSNVSEEFSVDEAYYPREAIVVYDGVVYIRNCCDNFDGPNYEPGSFSGSRYWIPVPKVKDGHRILLSGINCRMHIHKGESVWSKDGTTLHVSDKETDVYDGEYFIEE